MAGRAARASTTIPSILPGSSPSASDANHPTLTPKVRMLGYDWPRFHAAVHELMETHETLALITMGIFTAVLAWKLFRRSKLTGAEEAGLRVLSGAGFVTIVWTSVLGGKLMFEHAAGIPNAAMQQEMENREAGHHHEAGEAEEHEHAAPADTAKQGGHTHAPGTPPHQH